MLCALMIVYQNSKFSSILIQKVMMLLWVNGCWATATSRCFAFIYLLDGVRLVIKWRQVGFTASQLVQHPYIYHTITTATEKYRLNACTTVSLSYHTWMYNMVVLIQCHVINLFMVCSVWEDITLLTRVPYLPPSPGSDTIAGRRPPPGGGVWGPG